MLLVNFHTLTVKQLSMEVWRLDAPVEFIYGMVISVILKLNWDGDVVF